MKKIFCLFSFVLLLSCCAGEKRETKTGDMKIASSAFAGNKKIPDKYSCRGEDISPPLSFQNIPGEVKSLALIVDDPDAPSGTWVHWLIWNIPADTLEIKEDTIPIGAVQGVNSAKQNNYRGPCPPSGTHRYYFKLYALDTALNLPNSSDKKMLEAAMQGHILAESQLIGLFTR